MANSRKRFPVKILSLMKATAVGRPQETSRLGKLGHARFSELLSTFFGDVLFYKFIPAKNSFRAD